jgi:hypothetical protein
MSATQSDDTGMLAAGGIGAVAIVVAIGAYLLSRGSEAMPTRGGNPVLAGEGDPMWHPGDGAAENPDAPVPGVLSNLTPDDQPTDDETLGAGMEPQEPDSSVSWADRNETLRNVSGDDTTVEDTQDNPLYHEDDPSIENPDAAVDLGDPADWDWGA